MRPSDHLEWYYGHLLCLLLRKGERRNAFLGSRHGGEFLDEGLALPR
jgi:hypothetical protein